MVETMAEPMVGGSAGSMAGYSVSKSAASLADCLVGEMVEMTAESSAD